MRVPLERSTRAMSETAEPREDRVRDAELLNLIDDAVPVVRAADVRTRSVVQRSNRRRMAPIPGT